MDLLCIQISNLNLSSSLWTLRFSALPSDCTPALTFFLSMTCTLAVASAFLSDRVYPYLNSASSLFLLGPNSDYAVVNISLNNSSSLTFLNVCAPICSSSTDSRTNSFSLSIFSSSRNFFILVDFNCHHPFWELKNTLTPVWRKYVIESSLLTSFLSLTLTHQLTSITFLAVTLLLTSCTLSCSWKVLQDLVSDYLPIQLTVPRSLLFHLNLCPPSFNFQKVRLPT